MDSGALWNVPMHGKARKINRNLLVIGIISNLEWRIVFRMVHWYPISVHWHFRRAIDRNGFGTQSNSPNAFHWNSSRIQLRIHPMVDCRMPIRQNRVHRTHPSHLASIRRWVHLFIEKLTSYVSSILCSWTRYRYTARILTNDKTCITSTVGNRYMRCIHKTTQYLHVQIYHIHSFHLPVKYSKRVTQRAACVCVCVCITGLYTSVPSNRMRAMVPHPGIDSSVSLAPRTKPLKVRQHR